MNYKRELVAVVLVFIAVGLFGIASGDLRFNSLFDSVFVIISIIINLLGLFIGLSIISKSEKLLLKHGFYIHICYNINDIFDVSFAKPPFSTKYKWLNFTGSLLFSMIFVLYTLGVFIASLFIAHQATNFLIR